MGLKKEIKLLREENKFLKETILALTKRVEELEQLDKKINNESLSIMLASEETLKKNWDNKLDERWNNV